MTSGPLIRVLRRVRRLAVLIAGAVLPLGTIVGTAWAASDPSFATCQPGAAHYGQAPTCMCDVPGHLTNITYSDPLGGSGSDGGGIPGFVVPLFVLVVLIGIGTFVVKLSLARGMARDAGLDPDRAGWVTALSDDGLAATYLASSESGRQAAAPSRVARLRELDDLRSRA